MLYYPPGNGEGARLQPTRQSFADLLEEATRILGGLQEAGCRSGEAVLLELDDARDLLPSLWACLLGGLVAVPRGSAGPDSGAGRPPPLPSLGHGRPLIAVRRGDPAIASGEGLRVLSLQSLREAPAAPSGGAVGADAAALLLTTSGSTGVPRWVVLTHRNVMTSLAGSVHLNGYGAGEVSLNWLPLRHVGALLRSLREVLLGALQIQVPCGEVATDPLRWLDLLSSSRATLSWAPNFAFALLLEALRRDGARRGPWDLSALRSLHSSGEPVSGRTMLELARELEHHGLAETALHTAWGMTEVCFATCSRRLLEEVRQDPRRPPSAGRPIAGVSLRIVDDADRPLSEGWAGHLQVRGPAVGRYFDGDAAASFAAGDWLRTGDLGVLRDGALTVTGRASDRLIVRGRKIEAVEIEGTVDSVAGVTPGTAVVAEVHPPSGPPALAVFVVPASGVEELEPLARACRQRIARRHGVTARWVVPVASARLPRSPVGKLRRRELVARWRAGDLAAPGGYPFDLEAQPEKRETTAAPALGEFAAAAVAVAEVLAAALGRDSLPADEDFFAAGGDSLRVMQAVAVLRERFPAAGLSAVDLFRSPTAAALAARMAAQPDVSESPPVADGHAARLRRRQRRLEFQGVAAELRATNDVPSPGGKE